MCEFIDEYISASIPDYDDKLKDIVVKHRHSSYCRRNGRCRFEFPKPPSECTLIAEPLDDEDPKAGLTDEHTSILAKVHRVVSESKDCNLTLDEALSKACVDKKAYHAALQISTKLCVIVLKRNPRDSYINNYNPVCLREWNANTGLQFIVNAYSCVMYVASYMLKSEKAMGQLLKHVAKEHITEDLKTKLIRVGAAFLTHKEVSAQEAVYPYETLDLCCCVYQYYPKR